MSDVDRASFDAFLLALRVIYVAYELDQPATEFEKPFVLLREIADGHTTLASPAEMAAKFPALRDLMYDAASTVMEHDRETATRVLRGLSSTL
jgi:hypothetical protein